MSKDEGTGARRDRETKTRRLREVALEASERLEKVLPESEDARVLEEILGVPGREKAKGHGPSLIPQTDSIRGPMTGLFRGRTALISHVSPGMARTMSNILKHLGLTTTVASSLEDLDRDPGRQAWDIVLVQGSAMPWPGMKLVAATLEWWRGSNAPLALLIRPGDLLMPEAAGLGVSCILEWPFQPDKVRHAVSELLRADKLL